MAIKIPKQFYKGQRLKGLAFITPEGTDQAATNRKKTVDTWANQVSGEWQDNPEYDAEKNPYVRRQIYVHTGTDTSTYETFDNVPVEGFILSHSVSRWSTSNKWFEITDPRGFRIQIAADNLVQVLQHGAIRKGKFTGKYVYGREGANNVLLPINSEIYKQAFEHTGDLKAPRVSLRDLDIGDEVILLHGGDRRTVVYAGRYYHATTSYDLPKGYRNPHHSWDERRQAEPRTWKDKIGQPKHRFIDFLAKYSYHRCLEPCQPKILKIVKKAAKTPDVMATEILTVKGSKIREPYVPDEHRQNYYGWHNEPPHLDLYSMDRKELAAIIDGRKEMLANFVNEYNKGERE